MYGRIDIMMTQSHITHKEQSYSSMLTDNHTKRHINPTLLSLEGHSSFKHSEV